MLFYTVRDCNVTLRAGGLREATATVVSPRGATEHHLRAVPANPNYAAIAGKVAAAHINTIASRVHQPK